MVVVSKLLAGDLIADCVLGTPSRPPGGNSLAEPDLGLFGLIPASEVKTMNGEPTHTSSFFFSFYADIYNWFSLWLFADPCSLVPKSILEISICLHCD